MNTSTVEVDIKLWSLTMGISRFLLGSIVVGLALLNIGCSSGGDSAPPPTDPNTVFSLFAPNSFDFGYSETINYTGTDSAGGKWTGVVSAKVEAQSTFLGQPAIPFLVQFQLNNTTNGALINSLGRTYFSTTSANRHVLGSSTTESTTVSATTTAIPETAKIGDFGIVGSYTDNAGNIATESWRLDDGSGGRANLVQLSTEKDQFGNTTFSSTTTTLIDPDGSTVSRTVIYFFADTGDTLTLTGS